MSIDAGLREVLAAHVERGELPGLVALLQCGDEVGVEAIGTQDLDGPEPMRRDTIFRIASMTKPVVAATALMLVEEGRLRLDDPVDPLLPELADRRVLRRLEGPLDDTVPAARAITLRDLLTCRMGFGLILEPSGDFPIQRALDEAGLAPGPMPPDFGPDEFMRRLGALPWMQPPGEGWRYHTSFDVLCVLLARASARPLEELLRARLFEPLGMKDTGFSVPGSKRDRLATCYATDPESGELRVFDEALAGRHSRSHRLPSALVSTVDDYLAFAHLLLDRGRCGRDRLLSQASVAAMAADQLTAAQRAQGGVILGEYSWGLGMGVSPDHHGWAGGCGTSWASYPEAHAVGILMTQRLFDSPVGTAVVGDFWTAARETIQRRET